MAIELLTPFTKVKLEPEIKAKKNFDILKFHLIWIYYEPIYLYIKESKNVLRTIKN